MLCSISLWRYFSDSSGVSVGMCFACSIYCVSNGVGVRGKFSSVFLRWIPLVFFSKNRDLVIGDLVQFWDDMRVKFWAPPCLASMCCINPLYIPPSLPLSFRAFMSCSPMHIMYAFFNEKTYIPNILCGSCVTALDIHFGRPHMDLCNAIIFLSSFLMARRKYGTV